MHTTLPLRFRAHLVKGAGRGKKIGVPTLNLDLLDLPSNFSEGVYACVATLDDSPTPLRGALHYGPRPVFQDSVACEIFLIDGPPVSQPSIVNVEIVAYLRSVQNFSSKEALVTQIGADVKRTREILASQENSRFDFKKNDR